MIMEENLFIPVHDVLDNNIAQYKVLYDAKQFFSGPNLIVKYMGGIDRDFLPSELKVYSWPFIIFEPFVAIIVLYVCRVALSAWGSAYLGYCILGVESKRYRNIILFCGFIYGILPSSPIWDICFAVYPFLVAQLYKIYKNRRMKDSLILFAFPFFSELAHFGVFICAYLLLFIIVDSIFRRKVNVMLCIALSTIIFGYIVSEYRMFRLILFKDVVTLRSEMSIEYYSIPQIIRNIIDVFLNGQYHGGTSHKYFVFPLCFFYIGYLIGKHLKVHDVKGIFKEFFIWIMVLIVLNSIVYAFENCYHFKHAFTLVFPFMKGIGLERIIRINSFLWYFAFSVIMFKIQKYGYHMISMISCFLAVITVMFIPNTYNLIFYNLYSAQQRSKQQFESIPLNYGEFYSEDLFEEIKKVIDYNGEWSVAFGMHPAILSYNKISTLDGYHSWYSLEYKHRFREMIAPEFEMDEFYRNYFDNWGGRAYLYSNIVTYEPARDLGIECAELKIDSNVFKQMGGKYIFSRVRISNIEELGGVEIGAYGNEKSPYTIYVYEVY
jgi:hypothetical protein